MKDKQAYLPLTRTLEIAVLNNSKECFSIASAKWEELCHIHFFSKLLHIPFLTFSSVKNASLTKIQPSKIYIRILLWDIFQFLLRNSISSKQPRKHTSHHEELFLDSELRDAVELVRETDFLKAYVAKVRITVGFVTTTYRFLQLKPEEIQVNINVVSDLVTIINKVFSVTKRKYVKPNYALQ